MATEKKRKAAKPAAPKRKPASPRKKKKAAPVPLTGQQKKFDEGVYPDDLPSRYLRDRQRTLFLTGEINDSKVNSLIVEMKYLEALEPEKDIQLYIDSPGGSATAGFNLCHTMKSLKCDVATHAMGVAASAAALVLSCGTKGKRFVQPTSTVMLHHVLTIRDEWQSILDAEVSVAYAKRLDDILVQIISENSGLAESVVRGDIERDRYFIGEEAVKYGVADSVE